MAVIETKFSVGDVVYATEVAWRAVPVQCPDCLGTRKWEAHIPNGEVVAISCPACQFGYETRGTINEYRVTGSCRQLTIGSVRFDSEGEVEYMCKETGVGSGRIWKQGLLHDSLEDAEAVLPELVEAQTIEQRDRAAKEYAWKKSDDGLSRPGGMTAYYRKQIKDSKRQIASAEAGLKRIAQETPDVDR